MTLAIANELLGCFAKARQCEQLRLVVDVGCRMVDLEAKTRLDVV